MPQLYLYEKVCASEWFIRVLKGPAVTLPSLLWKLKSLVAGDHTIQALTAAVE